MANEQTKEETYAYYYHTNYIRNARAIAIAWAIFTLCFFIIMLVVFLQPYWLGDGPNSRGVGYFGLYRYCVTYSTVGELSCSSDSVFGFDGLKNHGDGGTVGHMAAATFFVGVAALFVALSILAMLLFLCKSCKTGTVFFTCGVLQLLSAVCLVIGILIYPGGWAKHSAYKSLCGEDVSYTNTAGCELRWVFYLAIIAVFDAFILAILAFILANKQDKLAMDMHYSDYIKSNGTGVHAKPKKHGTVNSTIFNTYPHRGHESDRPAINGSTARDESDAPIPQVEDSVPPYAQVTIRSRSSRDGDNTGTADDEMSSTSRSSKNTGKSSQKSSIREKDMTL